MKTIKSLIILSLMFFLGGQMMGQSGGALYLGASFPLGEYAEFDDFNDFALTNADGDDGAAGVGFNVGLKWYFNVGVKGLGVMLSVDGFYNGPNSNLKEKYRNNESHYSGHYISESFTYNATPKYINVPLMLGINYIYNINPNFGIYAEAGAGANLSFITARETEGRLEILGLEKKVVTTQKFDKVFSFAWQAGVGIEVAKNFRIGCSFYNLGKVNVKGDETVKTTGIIDNSTSTDTHRNTYGQLNPMMILARIGFSF